MSKGEKEKEFDELKQSEKLPAKDFADYLKKNCSGSEQHEKCVTISDGSDFTLKNKEELIKIIGNELYNQLDDLKKQIDERCK